MLVVVQPPPNSVRKGNGPQLCYKTLENDLAYVQIGLLEMLSLQAVIKSAASPASPKTKMQESRGASGGQLGMRCRGRLGSSDSGILVQAAALAADLITA